MAFVRWFAGAAALTVANVWVILQYQNVENRAQVLIPQTTLLLLAFFVVSVMVLRYLKANSNASVVYGFTCALLLIIWGSSLADAIEPSIRPWILHHQDWDVLRLYGSYLAAYGVLFTVGASIYPLVSGGLNLWSRSGDARTQ